MISDLKILNTIGDTFSPKAQNILEELGEVTHRNVNKDELLEIIAGYDIVVVGIYPMIDKEVIDKAKKLKHIVIPANTLENIDVDHAEKKGINIVSLYGELDFLDTITSTAELACGLMIDIVRFTPQAFESVKEYEWDRERFRGHTLRRKTLGIIGMGRLGKLMARYGQGLQMNVLFFDPYVENGIMPDCKKVSLNDLLAQSDIISLHPQLTDETENMINSEAFKKIKKNAYIVNTARDRIVNESDLVRALEHGEIAGYAADVLAGEFEFDTKGFKNHPLVEYAKTHNNVIIVPHTGGMTHESREDTDVFTTEKLKDIINL